MPVNFMKLRRSNACGSIIIMTSLVGPVAVRAAVHPAGAGDKAMADAAVQRLPVAEVEERRLLDQAHLETRLHHAVVVVELARDVRVLEHESVRVLEVDRLRPLVVDDGRHLEALLDELGALRLEVGLAPGFEGEVVHALRHPERAVQAAVELDRDARNTARLHEREQLPLSRVEEHVADLAALLHLDDVAANGLESEYPLVE